MTYSKGSVEQRITSPKISLQCVLNGNTETLSQTNFILIICMSISVTLTPSASYVHNL